MAQEKTNHLKIQFLRCTVYMFWSPSTSLLIHHPGLHLLPGARSAAAPARAPMQPWLWHPPQPAGLSRTTLAPGLLQAHWYFCLLF